MSMDEQTLAIKLLKKLNSPLRLEKLQGDASSRSFYRVFRENNLPSLILMVETDPFDPDRSPFCQMQGFLAGIGIPVPGIEAMCPAEGWVLMNDAGPTTLQEYLLRTGDSTIRTAYRRAIRILLMLQDRGTRELPAQFEGARLHLDRQKLAGELRFTWTHLLQGLFGLDLPRQEAERLDGWADRIGDRLEKTEQVLCHRDYHSRNLLWDGREMAVVDFQDARLGPALYDLASLLLDPYLDLGEDLKEEMFWEFMEGKPGGKEKESGLRDQFDLSVVQRCLKAAGTYAYQVTARKRSHFNAYIPAAMRNALQALRRFPEYDPILRLLERYQEEGGLIRTGSPPASLSGASPPGSVRS